MAMRAGKLSRRVTLQTLTMVADGGGGSTETWADTVTVWAAVRPLQGVERYRAQQVLSDLTTEVEIRYRAGVVPQQRFKYGSRFFVIIQPPINVDEKNERLVCLCEERHV